MRQQANMHHGILYIDDSQTFATSVGVLRITLDLRLLRYATFVSWAAWITLDYWTFGVIRFTST